MLTFTDIEARLSVLPASLQNSVKHNIERWLSQINEENLTVNLSDDVLQALVKCWGASEFVAETCVRNPVLLADLIGSGDLEKVYAEPAFADKLAALTIGDEAELMLQLRQFRRREMVRIAWRDLAGWAGLNETLMDLSLLADACIQFALDFLYHQACEVRGTPVLADGTPQQVVVLGMGKLGAYELNYSSDIDLIFAYAEDGTLPDRKETSYGEFFTRLCQKLVKVLDEITVDGFVFRTDIRLRPFGDSGPIIMTFNGMENYYLTQAREWERYAMIKARQVAGDFATGKYLMSMLSAFVYRRYLDYGAFEELRSLKLQIAQELKRKDRMDNVKLGPGGIREIEFIGQAFQLIRGGQDKSLQTRGILDVLCTLAELKLMPEAEVDLLTSSYIFLRRVENHIQQYQDRQTHDLPVAEIPQAALAFSMGYASWADFRFELDRVRRGVHQIFDQVFSVSKQDEQHEVGKLVWAMAADEQDLYEALQTHGYTEADKSLTIIKDFKHSAALRRMTAKGAGVVDRLMPQLIEALPQVANPDESLQRLTKLFENIAGRNIYLSLLEENPDALNQLIQLASASAWVCDFLAQYPILFDELLDTRRLYEPLKRADLDRQLARQIAEIDVQDIEALMIKLREFKHLNVLRVAAADIMDAIPLMVVSDYLTYIAESIVEQTVKRTWLMLTEKHGFPPDTSNEHMNFAVIGFGKLGGLELGYGSDLDLVFIYDCADGNAMTTPPPLVSPKPFGLYPQGHKSLSNSEHKQESPSMTEGSASGANSGRTEIADLENTGIKPISVAQFYGRLGLKIRHILDTKMLSGVLYEVDMRLRPNGDSGLLVAHIKAYEEYQRENAWTWEHQALVRGRFIAGDLRLKAEFEAIRHKILSSPRDVKRLQAEVREMREKMRAAHDTADVDQFDLKQGKGGIADIEFIVQFAILAHAAQQTGLTTYTDNVRLLEGLAQYGLVSEIEAQLLKTAYCTYRDLGHKQVLQGDKAIIDKHEVSALQQHVEQIWQRIMVNAID